MIVMTETNKLYNRRHAIEWNRLECDFALHIQLLTTLSPFSCHFGDPIAISFDVLPLSTITNSQFQFTMLVKSMLALSSDVHHSLSHSLTEFSYNFEKGKRIKHNILATCF